jgi:hypothetical protein
MPLAVGACVGRVVRHLPDGFAVKFVEQQSRDDLDRLVIRPAPRSAGGTKAAPVPEQSRRRPLQDAKPARKAQ